MPRLYFTVTHPFVLSIQLHFSLTTLLIFYISNDLFVRAFAPIFGLPPGTLVHCIFLCVQFERNVKCVFVEIRIIIFDNGLEAIYTLNIGYSGLWAFMIKCVKSQLVIFILNFIVLREIYKRCYIFNFIHFFILDVYAEWHVGTDIWSDTSMFSRS